MYPSDVKELAALITAISPLLLWAVSGVVSSRARWRDASLAQWRRINELTLALYNKDGNHGLWSQIAAIHELAEATGKQRLAARTVLTDAQQHFKTNAKLTEALATAITRLDRCTVKRLAGF